MRAVFVLPFVLSMLLALPASAAQRQRTWQATVTHITDGDTLWVRPLSGGAGVQLRLQGIDAPELCQTYGPQARAALLQRLLRQQVTVAGRGLDAYDRTLARVHWAGQDVGGWLVFNGLAWSYRHRRSDGPYHALQQQAVQARRGLWSQSRPIEPRTFRRQHGACPRPEAQ